MASTDITQVSVGGHVPWSYPGKMGEHGYEWPALSHESLSVAMALHCGELIQIIRFYPQMAEFAQIYLNEF